MTFPAILFASLVVLLPAAGEIESRADRVGETTEMAQGSSVRELAPLKHRATIAGQGFGDAPFRQVAESLRDDKANQVRIEQQMTIRISPRPAPVRPNMLMYLPSGEISPHLAERKMGKCLKVAGIAGVQPNGANRLLLFLRDRRLVSAELERSCRSREFYSGFYLSRSNDGKLCVDRDTLLSRSGANCKLTRIRQLVELEE